MHHFLKPETIDLIYLITFLKIASHGCKLSQNVFAALFACLLALVVFGIISMWVIYL